MISKILSKEELDFLETEMLEAARHNDSVSIAAINNILIRNLQNMRQLIKESGNDQ